MIGINERRRRVTISMAVLAAVTIVSGCGSDQGEGTQGQQVQMPQEAVEAWASVVRPEQTRSIDEPIVTDRAIQGAIDLHAHQDPDSYGPSYGQGPRAIDALDLVARARAAGMRGFVIKQHMDQTAGLAYYIRKLYPDMEVFGGMGSNLTTGPTVNPWAITHMSEIKGGWGRIVWMPSWNSEHTSHENNRSAAPGFVSVARCADGGLYWANYPTPCPNAKLRPEVIEAISVIATARTRDSNGRLILATGHNGAGEVRMMIEEALRVGVETIIITHPLLEAVGLTNEEIAEFVNLGPGIYAEFVSSFGNENAPRERTERRGRSIVENVEGIRAAGVEHAYVSSDRGQGNNDWQPDALAKAAQRLRSEGFTEAELDLLFKINPAKILGLPLPGGATP